MAAPLSHTQQPAPCVPDWVAAKQAALMVCRSWAVTDAFGKEQGRQYILSDNRGFVVQGVVHCDHPDCSLCTLEEGSIYNFSGFTLVSNTSAIQFHKQGTNVLDVSSCNNVIHLECPTNGFVRYPVDLVRLEQAVTSDINSIIDVMGLVIAVGVSRPTIKGNCIVDCHIISWRGTTVRLMLWNETSADLVAHQARNPGKTICIFTHMEVRKYEGFGSNEVYLSSTPGTTVHAAESISSSHPELQKYERYPPFHTNTLESPHDEGNDHSLTQILYIARANSRNRNAESITANCKVKVLGIRKDHPWFSLTCPIAKCQKGVVKAGSVFWCNSCEQLFPHTVPSYRVHADVTDGISTVTVGFLDSIGDSLLQIKAQDMLAELGDSANPDMPPPHLLSLCNPIQIVQLKSHTFVDHLTHESFVCSAIIPPSRNMNLGIVVPPRAASNVVSTTTVVAPDMISTPKEKWAAEKNAPVGTTTPAAKPRKAKRALTYSSEED